MSRITERRLSSGARFYFWAAVVALLLIAAVTAPHLIRHDPYLVDLTQVNKPPGHGYIMGTDYVGRCIFCRLVEGAARSVYSALLVVALTFVIGTLIGVFCGFFGGAVDTILMRVVDSFQAFPSLVFTVAVAGMLGRGMLNCVIAMTVVGWTGYARLARSQVLSLKEQAFVSAARISGMSPLQILFKTILPHSVRSLVVFASMHVGNAILSFAGLSYLGLGTAPPYPEWGTMLSDGQQRLQTAPWAVFFPGLAILLVVMTTGMFGDSINEKLSPQKNEGNDRSPSRQRAAKGGETEKENKKK